MALFKGSHAVPFLALSAATLITAAGCTPGPSEESVTEVRTERYDCVKKVDPNDNGEEPALEVVDPSLCEHRTHSAGGGIAGGLAGYFIARHLMGQTMVGQRFNAQPVRTGGNPLIRADDVSARTSAGVPSSFSSGTSTGRSVSVTSGGIGGKSGSGGS